MASRRRVACEFLTSRIIDVRGDVPDVDARLSEYMQSVLNAMRNFAREIGLEDPVILSGARSPALQHELQRDWDRGEREGLAVRPVENSKHIPDASGIYRAIDLGNSEFWIHTVVPSVVQAFKYLEWGGNYLPRDIRHLEEQGR